MYFSSTVQGSVARFVYKIDSVSRFPPFNPLHFYISSMDFLKFSYFEEIGQKLE